MDSSALMRLPKEELAIAYEDAVAERPLPPAAEAVIAGGVAMGVGFADAQIGDGEGALAAGLALGASFATMVATGGEGNLGKTARASFIVDFAPFVRLLEPGRRRATIRGENHRAEASTASSRHTSPFPPRRLELAWRSIQHGRDGGTGWHAQLPAAA